MKVWGTGVIGVTAHAFIAQVQMLKQAPVIMTLIAVIRGGRVFLREGRGRALVTIT